MSLNFYLDYPSTEHTCTCERCGNVYMSQESERVASFNITHNLGQMADQAGIYDALWKPAESGFASAREVAASIRSGLEKLRARPDHYAQFNATNGWGTYEQFILWLEKVLVACEEHPDAIPGASR